MTEHIPSEILEWLKSLTNFERKLPAKYVASTFNTDRYRLLLERLGNPHRSGIPTVQVLGTDGKGSTLALLEALLNREGRRTKSFISPHLQQVEERFRFDGNSVASLDFINSLEKIQEVSVDFEGLTYFEALNAAFWVWVRADPPDFVLLETGLGGRLDTTTICEPSLKILTRLERDHFKILGPTMDRIASEKLAALRSGVPALIAPQSPFLKVQIVAFLHDRRIPGEWVFEEIETSVIDRSLSAWTHQLTAKDGSNLIIEIPLLGDHQSENLAGAALAFRRLTGAWPEGEDPIRLEPKWLGRCQTIDRGDGKWVLDGSHTAHSGRALLRTLDQLFDPSIPREFFFTATRDRFPWCYLRGLVRHEDALHLVDYPHERLWIAGELEQRLIEEGWNEYRTPALNIFPFEETLNLQGGPSTKIFCGSFYWVGAVLNQLADRS